MPRIPVRRHARRRVGTIDSVEVHTGTKASEIGFTGWSLITRWDFNDAEHQFVLRHTDGSLGGILLARSFEDTIDITIDFLEIFWKDRGYGTRLVRAFEKWAREQGYERIWFKSKHRSYGFWQKMGYQLDRGEEANVLDNLDYYEFERWPDFEARRFWYRRGIESEDASGIGAQVEKEVRAGQIPDELFERPGLLSDTITMEKRLRRQVRSHRRQR